MGAPQGHPRPLMLLTIAPCENTSVTPGRRWIRGPVALTESRSCLLAGACASFLAAADHPAILDP